MRNFLSIGSPQMGFTEIPEGGCSFSVVNHDKLLCDFEKAILNGAGYEPLFQDTIAPAGYYRDSENLTNYRKYSSYLAKLNNEVNPASENSQK